MVLKAITCNRDSEQYSVLNYLYFNIIYPLHCYYLKQNLRQYRRIKSSKSFGSVIRYVLKYIWYMYICTYAYLYICVSTDI